jgi:hypothetical protein
VIEQVEDLHAEHRAGPLGDLDAPRQGRIDLE